MMDIMIFMGAILLLIIPVVVVVASISATTAGVCFEDGGEGQEE